MTKWFCDQCGKAIEPADTHRIIRKSGRIKVEVMVAVDNVWNGGHACTECVVEAVTQGEAA